MTGLITRGGVALIGGPPKTSKTWLAEEIAIAIATGTRVCGEFTTLCGKAVYFFAEDLATWSQRRTTGSARRAPAGSPR